MQSCAIFDLPSPFPSFSTTNFSDCPRRNVLIESNLVEWFSPGGEREVSDGFAREENGQVPYEQTKPLVVEHAEIVTVK